MRKPARYFFVCLLFFHCCARDSPKFVQFIIDANFVHLGIIAIFGQHHFGIIVGSIHIEDKVMFQWFNWFFFKQKDNRIQQINSNYTNVFFEFGRRFDIISRQSVRFINIKDDLPCFRNMIKHIFRCPAEISISDLLYNFTFRNVSFSRHLKAMNTSNDCFKCFTHTCIFLCLFYLLTIYIFVTKSRNKSPYCPCVSRWF